MSVNEGLENVRVPGTVMQHDPSQVKGLNTAPKIVLNTCHLKYNQIPQVCTVVSVSC